MPLPTLISLLKTNKSMYSFLTSAQGISVPLQVSGIWIFDDNTVERGMNVFITSGEMDPLTMEQLEDLRRLPLALEVETVWIYLTQPLTSERFQQIMAYMKEIHVTSVRFLEVECNVVDWENITTFIKVSL